MSRARVQPDVVRMLTLVPWLLERPGASLEETASAFATDVATVRAELEHLDYCGLPGLGGGALFDVTIVGDHVTVRMADELRYPMRPTAPEALRLLLMATAAERVVGADVPALRSAVAKLHATLGIAPGAVTVLDAEPSEVIARLRAAIADGHRVRFEYRGRDDRAPQERRIEPWVVELHDGAWYLHGHDVEQDAARMFRLDRMAGLVVTDDAVTTERPVDLPHPAYAPGDHDVEVLLRLGPAAAWLLDAVQADEVHPEGDDGTVRVHLRTGSEEWLARLVLMAAGRAEVLQPESLRERVRSLSREALDRLG